MLPIFLSNAPCTMNVIKRMWPLAKLPGDHCKPLSKRISGVAETPMEQKRLRATVAARAFVSAVRGRITRCAAAAQSGQSLVEYALILAFVALVVIVAMQLLQPAISATFNHVTNCLNSANGTSTITGTTPRC